MTWPRRLYILKRKSFATLTEMLVPFFGLKQSLSDKLHETQTSEWCGVWLPICNNNSKATPNFIVTWLQYFTCYAKIFIGYLYQYPFSEAEWKTNSNQVNVYLCQCSLGLRDVFNFLTLLAV